MGQECEATCRDCGATSSVSVGGGFVFHLLHCDTCGAERSVPFDAVIDAHRRWVKGLTGPWSTVTSRWDRAVQADPSVEPMSDEDYYAAIGQVAGRCKCGGVFAMDAPPRCRVCRSTALDIGEVLGDYD